MNFFLEFIDYNLAKDHVDNLIEVDTGQRRHTNNWTLKEFQIFGIRKTISDRLPKQGFLESIPKSILAHYAEKSSQFNLAKKLEEFKNMKHVSPSLYQIS